MSSHMLTLTDAQAALLEIPLEGEGGFQTFGRKLQSQIDRGGRKTLITLTDEDVGKVIRYASYDKGGFEGRLARALGPHLQIKGYATELEGLL